MSDKNIKAALAKYWDIKAKKAKTLQTNKSAALDKHLEIQAKRSMTLQENKTLALDKHLEIQAKRSINRTAALNKWRTLSGFGTTPQNIKHFPIQRKKK